MSRAFLNKKIDSKEAAHAYLKELFENDLLYHPDESAEKIVFPEGVSDEELKLMDERMVEVFEFDPDPSGYIMDNLINNQNGKT